MHVALCLPIVDLNKQKDIALRIIILQDKLQNPIQVRYDASYNRKT